MTFTEDTLAQLEALHDIQETIGINKSVSPSMDLYDLETNQDARVVLQFFTYNYKDDRDYSYYLGTEI